MFTVRTQFRNNIVETPYESQTQAFMCAVAAINSRRWTHVMVISHETDEAIAEWGGDPTSILGGQHYYATSL